MVQNKKTSSKIQKFLSGKGFYIALAFCLLAVGASAYTAIRMGAQPEVETPYVADGQQEPDVEWGDQQANVPATEVPDTRENTTQPPTTEAESQTQAHPLPCRWATTSAWITATGKWSTPKR